MDQISTDTTVGKRSLVYHESVIACENGNFLLFMYVDVCCAPENISPIDVCFGGGVIKLVG